MISWLISTQNTKYYKNCKKLQKTHWCKGGLDCEGCYGSKSYWLTIPPASTKGNSLLGYSGVNDIPVLRRAVDSVWRAASGHFRDVPPIHYPLTQHFTRFTFTRHIKRTSSTGRTVTKFRRTGIFFRKSVFYWRQDKRSFMFCSSWFRITVTRLCRVGD